MLLKFAYNFALKNAVIFAYTFAFKNAFAVLNRRLSRRAPCHHLVWNDFHHFSSKLSPEYT